MVFDAKDQNKAGMGSWETGAGAPHVHEGPGKVSRGGDI